MLIYPKFVLRTDSSIRLPFFKCNWHDIQNYVTDQYVKLLVAFLTFHLGMFSTIIFFRGRQQRELEGLNISKETGKDVE